MNPKFASTLLLLALSAIPLAADSSHIGQEVMINPSSRFEINNGCNMLVTADFLWWSANTDGLYYAQSNVGTTTTLPSNGNVDFSGHLQRVKEEWGPGFRVGFGGNMPYDEWDIYLNWTWFQADPKDSAKQTSSGPLLVLWGHPDAPEGRLATRAHGKWDLKTNVLDLEMGRSFWAGMRFSLRPFLGIRGAWIDQEFKIKYDYATSPTVEGEIKAKSDFEGVGVRAGVDLRFALFNGWSLYGLAAGSLMYGHLDCNFHEKSGSSLVARTSDGFHRGVSTLQMGIGTRWDHYFNHKRYHVGVAIGWEQNIWYGITQFNHYYNQLQTGTLVQNNGDLTLQGGTLSARFDF
jgi:hypothetical protein